MDYFTHALFLFYLPMWKIPMKIFFYVKKLNHSDIKKILFSNIICFFFFEFLCKYLENTNRPA